MNAKDCNYIAKDKILPWINARIKEQYESLNPCNYMATRELEKIRACIEMGLFDWQEEE